MILIRIILFAVFVVVLGVFGGVTFGMLHKVRDLEAQIEYYSSVCGHAVLEAERIQRKLDEHIKSCGKEKTKAYFQGISSVRFAKSEMKNKNGSD